MFFFPTLTVVLTDDQMIKSQQQIMSFGRSLYIDGIFPPNRSLIYIIIGLKSEYSKNLTVDTFESITCTTNTFYSSLKFKRKYLIFNI